MTADTLAILRCEPGRRATKLIRRCTTGIVVDGFDAGAWFAVEVIPVDGLASLVDALDGTTADPRALVIRGEPLPETNRERCRRLLHEQEDGTPPTFADTPRRWLLLDFDAIGWPRRGREFRWPWTDGALSGLYVRSLLPAEFQRSSFWWSFTSSAGFKPGLRMRLAFWLDRRVTGDELKRWLAGAPVDHAIFGAVQPVYLANPILRAVSDPVPERRGLELDVANTVTVPELRPATSDRAATGTSEQWRAMPAAAHGWQYGILQEVAEDIARAPPAGTNRWGHSGRHSALFCGALRVSGLIGEGLLDPGGAVRTLAAAAHHAGIAEREAARTIRNAFRQGGLSA